MPMRKATVRSRRLGAELRRLREVAQVSAEGAATHLECSKAKISRIETGTVAVRARDVRDLLGLYDVADPLLAGRLEELARGSAEPNWWASYGDTIPPDYADYLELEQSAEHVRTFQTVVVPGLLQTDEYAQAIMAVNPAAVDPLAVDSLLKIRRDRQALFWADDASAARLTCVIWEPVLLTGIGGSAQLTRLLDQSRRPGVSLHILPTAAGPRVGLSSPFVLLEFAEPDPPVVLVDNLTCTLFMETRTEIQGYRLVFDELLGAAANVEASRELIVRAISRFDEGQA